MTVRVSVAAIDALIGSSSRRLLRRLTYAMQKLYPHSQGVPLPVIECHLTAGVPEMERA